MNKDCEHIIYSAEQIAEAVKKIGEKITEDYKGKEIAFVSILNGA